MALDAVNLPNLNGALEAGLAVGTDPSLPEEKKLRLSLTGDVSACSTKAMVWAAVTFANASEKVKALYMSGAALCVTHGLAQRVGAAPDGDWVVDETLPLANPEQQALIARLVTRENLQQALTIAVATKATWWVSNHHTGQGYVPGYTKKVLSTIFPQGVTEEAVDCAHTIGHWVSTIKVLTVAEVADL